MTINKIEVSLFPSESALSKYPIKRPTIILEKRLILAWRVTYDYYTTLVVEIVRMTLDGFWSEKSTIYQCNISLLAPRVCVGGKCSRDRPA